MSKAAVAALLCSIFLLLGYLFIVPLLIFMGQLRAVDHPLEAVLPVGSVLVARFPAGQIRIIAIDSSHRKYEWRNRSVIADMPGRSKRWLGSLGISNAQPFWFGKGWSERGIVSESQLHFSSRKRLEEWLVKRNFPPFFEPVWTSTGLWIEFFEVSGRDQINIRLHQLCVGDHKPTALSGARDEFVSLTGVNGTRSMSLACSNPGMAGIVDVGDGKFLQ